MDIKIKTITKKVYITKDGKEFENEDEAREWQHCLVIMEKARELEISMGNLEQNLNEVKKLNKYFKTP